MTTKTDVSSSSSELVHKMAFMLGNKTLVCQDPSGIAATRMWNFGNPLNSPTSLLLLQLSAISMASQLIDICLKPLGQSTVVSKILGGMVFGPSLLGHKEIMSTKLFPARGNMVIHTMATFGIMFFMFTIGVKMDSSMMIRPERKAVVIGFSVFFFTLLLPGLLAYVLKRFVPMNTSLENSLPLLTLSQSVTGFPTIAVLLTELKIQNTDIGRLAVSAAMFCDIIGIALTAVVLAVLENKSNPILTSVLAILSAIALVLVIVFLIRPTILLIIKYLPQGKSTNDMHILVIILFVIVIGFLSETIGQHYVLGPLVLGLAIPDGPHLGATLESKLDTFAAGLFYPTYLAISGQQTDIFKIQTQGCLILGGIILFGCVVKIGAVMGSTMYIDLPLKDAFVLGLILNGKGIAELNIYNLWRGSKILEEEEFSLSVISVVLVTAIITPMIKALYDPSRQYIAMKRNTIQHSKNESELRILVCIHNHDNVPSIIDLLEVSLPASRDSGRSNTAVIALILSELVGRSAPVLVAHQTHRTLRTSTSKSCHIINALRHYEIENEGSTTVESFTSISPFDTMHEDVCWVAFDKRATVVILPFHKQWAIDGSVGSDNRAIRNMNINVLKRAPCSVGILIDRRIQTGPVSLLSDRPFIHVAVIYIGGADDAESLAYGARMAKTAKVDLTVVRFLLFGAENSKDRKRDSDLINEYRRANVGNERFVIIEEVVRDGLGLSSCMREMLDCFDLMLVGRHHQDSPILMGLNEWNECPELGVIGDMLASPDIRSAASVLVVQQQRIRGKLANHLHEAVGDRDSTFHDFQHHERVRRGESLR